MTFDDLCALVDEQQIPTDAEILAREGDVGPGDTFFPYTIEGITVNNHGQVRLIIEPLHNDDLED